MTSAAIFIEAARREIGTKESPAGSNKTPYAAIAGHANAQPWCATFIVAVARRVGLHLESESAYTPAMADGFRHAGRFDQTPELGAIAFYDFPDSKHRIQHVGIVSGWTASTVTTVEGNTSSGATGSQDNGGTVAERTRPRTHVVGFGHPVFTDQPPAPEVVRMQGDVAATRSPNGGVWVLQKDGGVRAYRGAPFLGSYPGLPEKDRQGRREFVDIEGERGGYVLIADDGATYTFLPKD